MEIVNNEELDTWLFERSCKMGHQCDGIKGVPDGWSEEVNIAWRDMVTGETINVVYA